MENPPTLKRSYEETARDAEASKKMKPAGEEAVELSEVRLLIDNFEASVIIGKGGDNVKAIRQETGTFVSVLRNDNKESKERILTIKGDVESISAAFAKIHELLMNNAIQRAANAGVRFFSSRSLFLCHRLANSLSCFLPIFLPFHQPALSLLIQK
jgi:predicted PilT family ATPase